MMKSNFIVLVCCLVGFSYAQLSQEQVDKKFAKKMKYYAYIDHPDEAYFLSAREVTNLDYLEFIYSIERDYGSDSSSQLALDTFLWEQSFPSAESMTAYYHKHPAYHNYPVVNVSHEKAELYCQWLEKTLNEQEHLQFAQYKVSLPSEEEWIYAASGEYTESSFPWYGEGLRDGKGDYICNFNAVSQLDIALNENKELVVLEDTSSTGYTPIQIHPTMAYNDFNNDLYDMGGNIAEFVSEKGITKGGSFLDPGYYLRNEVSQSYSGSGAAVNHGFRVMVKLIPKAST